MKFKQYEDPSLRKRVQNYKYQIKYKERVAKMAKLEDPDLTSSYRRNKIAYAYAKKMPMHYGAITDEKDQRTSRKYLQQLKI